MRRHLAVALLIGAGAGLTACGGSSAHQSQVPPARLEHVNGSSKVSVVLTPVGAERIGIQTASVAAVHSGGGSQTRIPYSALVYEPDGTPVVYINLAVRVYTQVPVSIAYFSGDRAYLKQGPAPGTAVVTVGAEELLGVQDGVGQEL